MAGVNSISKQGEALLTGHVTVSEGAGITLTQVGQDIEIAASGVTPTEPIGSPQAWYGAHEPTSITTVSNRISQWNDLTGNGNHLTQGTAADRPFYSGTPRVVNGFTIPEFTLTQEFLDCSLVTSDRTSTHMIACLIDSFTTTLIGSAGGTGGFEARIDANVRVQYLKAGVSAITAHTGWPMQGGTGLPTFVQVLCARMNNTTLFQDVLSGATFSPSAEATTFTAGRTLRLGTDQSGTVPFDGLIMEYVYYDTQLSDADMEQNFLMMYDRWCVA